MYSNCPCLCIIVKSVFGGRSVGSAVAPIFEEANVDFGFINQTFNVKEPVADVARVPVQV